MDTIEFYGKEKISKILLKLERRLQPVNYFKILLSDSAKGQAQINFSQIISIQSD